MPQTVDALDGIIFDTVASLVIVIDSNGVIVRANAAAERASGYSRTELVGRAFAELFIAPEDYERAQASFWELLQGRGGGRCEAAMTARDGTRRQIDWASSAVLGGDPIVDRPEEMPNIPFRWVIATGVDVTERRAVEDEHRLQRELLQTIFDHVPGMLCFFDASGKLKIANRAWQEILGWPLEDAQKIDVLAEVTPNDAVYMRATEFIRRGEGNWEDFPLRTRDGQPIHTTWANVRLSDGSIIGIGQDITARKHAEDALRRSEARLRWMVDSNVIGVFFYHLDGDITGGNDAFLRMVGYARDDLERGLLRWNDMTPPEFKSLDERGAAELLATGLCRPYEKEFFRKDGSRAPILIGGTSFDPGGSEGVCFVLDLSDRRAADAAMRQLNETLEQRVADRTAELTAANRALREQILERQRVEESLRQSEAHFKELAQRNERLVQEVEHRVRNNLAGLIGLVSAMSQRASDVASFSGAIQSRLAAMVHIHRVLAESDWREFDLNRLIRSTLDTVKHLAPVEVRIEIEGPAVSLSTRHALPLTMVLVEWFTNSCKYGAHSVATGRVKIQWELLDSSVRLTWQERNGPRIEKVGAASVGTELVRGFVRNELQGQCELSYPPEGATYVIQFPLSLVA